MESRKAAEPVDPRIFYWTYTVAACLGGIVLAAWGPLWFGAHLPDLAWGRAALIRLGGTALIAAGLFAGSLATMDDPIARRRSHRWFVAANAVVFVTIFTQHYTVVGGPPLRYAAALLFLVVVLGVMVGLEHASDPRRHADIITLFGGKPRQASIGELRSRYEQQIREAGAQEERNRLARDLHDSIKQQIFAMQTAAATAQVRFESDPAGSRAALDQVRASAREAMTEMEAMLDQLRAAPLENVGLVEALRRQCEALAFRTGARVDFRAGALPPGDALPPGAHQAILRVAQEALANVGRHSRAKHVAATLDSAGGRVELKIADDGVGFDPNVTSAGMGLSNMRQRASQYDGYLMASGRPGEGTTVTLWLPFAVPPAHPGRHLAYAVVWAVVMALYAVPAVRDPFLLLLPLCFLPALISQVRLYLRGRTRRETR